MRYLSDRLALVAVLLPAVTLAQNAPPSQTVIPTSPTKIEEPILRFDVVDIPGKGQIVSVAGRVERWTRRGWVDVAPGETVENDARLQLPANSDLVIRFSGKSDLRFSAMPTVRRVAFRVLATP
ncbi:MAG: hypothetical protein U1F18_07675 [Steroidobacteraceae bacterium]